MGASLLEGSGKSYTSEAVQVEGELVSRRRLEDLAPEQFSSILILADESATFSTADADQASPTQLQSRALLRRNISRGWGLLHAMQQCCAKLRNWTNHYSVLQQCHACLCLADCTALLMLGRRSFADMLCKSSTLRCF